MPTGLFAYHIKGDFKIIERMTPLGKFELSCRDGVVRKVLHFQPEGSGPSAATGANAATGAGGTGKITRKMMRIVVKTWVLHIWNLT